MIPPANARVDPRTVVVPSVDTMVTNIAVSTPRQDNNFALWTEFTCLKFLKHGQLGDTSISFNDARIDVPSEKSKQTCDQEEYSNQCLCYSNHSAPDEITLFYIYVGKDYCI